MKKAAVTLLELLIALILLSVIILSFSTIENFSRNAVLNTERRAKVQNDLSFILSHMKKSVQRGIGDINNKPLENIAGGFRVRVDYNTIATPENYSDDWWFNYTLNANTLSFSCTPACPAACQAENLSTKIVSFNYNFLDNDTILEVAIVARYDPASAASADNPEVVMKTSILARSTASR